MLLAECNGMKRNISSLCLAVAVLTCFSYSASAQGGPPFRSDDPDTPGNKNWEINTVLMADRNPSEGSYAMPDVDINYGLGNRIQLKYELPISLQESRGSSSHLLSGLGNSLLGVKWRFYSHHPRSNTPGHAEKRESNFGFSIYPQLLLNNPTSSVRRGIVPPGPQFLIPAEANARIGPLRLSGEFGRWFTTKDVPGSWIRGLIVGHEFRGRTEVSVELYDQNPTSSPASSPKTRESTLGVGCRTPIAGEASLWLIAMAGRSLATVTRTNDQPSWIATLGLQVLTGHRKRYSSE